MKLKFLACLSIEKKLYVECESYFQNHKMLERNLHADSPFKKHVLRVISFIGALIRCDKSPCLIPLRYLSGLKFLFRLKGSESLYK